MSYKILLIEDNLEMAENIASILQFANYQVEVAKDGKEGVLMAQKGLPDLILCDIMMPELDGYSVLHILNNKPETADIPFIFLTAKADKKDFREGMNLGADDYIIKPFDGLDLLKVVEMRLKKNESIKSKYKEKSNKVNEFLTETKEIKGFENLSNNRQTKIFRKKDYIFMEGQNPNSLFCILRGQVKTFKMNYFGKELITGIFKEGDFFGYVPLLEDFPYKETAEALDEVEVAIIPKSDFLDLMYSNKEVAKKFMKMLSNNLEEMENRLLEIAYQSVRQRVAITLLKIHEQHFGEGDDIIQISRKDIASIVGTTTESLNRTLADFKEEKLIEILNDGLKIVDREKLKRVKNQ